MNTQDWSPLGWTGWISFESKGFSRVFSNWCSKASILQCSAFFIVQLSHPYKTTGKTIALTRRTSVGKVMSLLFNILSSLVITFLPRSKRLLILWLQSQWFWKGYPLQYSGLENSMDCIVHGVTKSQTWLSDFHFTSLHFTSLLALFSFFLFFFYHASHFLDCACSSQCIGFNLGHGSESLES